MEFGFPIVNETQIFYNQTIRSKFRSRLDFRKSAQNTTLKCDFSDKNWTNQVVSLHHHNSPITGIENPSTIQRSNNTLATNNYSLKAKKCNIQRFAV